MNDLWKHASFLLPHLQTHHRTVSHLDRIIQATLTVDPLRQALNLAHAAEKIEENAFLGWNSIPYSGIVETVSMNSSHPLQDAIRLYAEAIALLESFIVRKMESSNNESLSNSDPVITTVLRQIRVYKRKTIQLESDM